MSGRGNEVADGTQPPLVSLLIPTFDRPHFLREALLSVLAQDHHELEVIVGDDGDRGAEVVTALRDPRVRYQRNSAPSGMVANWTSLLDAARGDLVGLLMDDDRLLPTYVSACVAAFAAEPEVGVVFTNHTFVSANSEDVRPSLVSPGRHDAFAGLFLDTLPVAISAALIRRELWPVARPLPDTGASDQVLFGRLASAGAPFFYIDEPLMRYRTHADMYSATLDFRDDGVRAWEALDVPGDPRAQRARDRRLAEALTSRAAASVQRGRRTAALEDLRRARSLRATSRRKLVALQLAARSRMLTRAAQLAACAKRRLHDARHS